MQGLRHQALVSLLCSQASQLFRINEEEAHSSLQLLEQPQKVDSTHGEYTLHAVLEGLVSLSRPHGEAVWERDNSWSPRGYLRVRIEFKNGVQLKGSC